MCQPERIAVFLRPSNCLEDCYSNMVRIDKQIQRSILVFYD